MAWNDIERLRERFHFTCDVPWDDMDPTASPGVRNCRRCDKAVFAALTEADFDHHARLGRCVFAPTSHGPALVAKPGEPPEPPPPPPPLAGAPRMLPPPRPQRVPISPPPDIPVKPDAEPPKP